MKTCKTFIVLTELLVLMLTIFSCEDQNKDFKVIVGKATSAFPRHSEGDVAVLADGSYLLVYTRFVGGWGDMDEAQLVERRSFDKGKTWSETKIILQQIGWNIMSASLNFISDGTPVLFYLHRDLDRPHQIINIMIAIAKDSYACEWQEPKQVNTEQGYHVVNNARVLKTSHNRLLVPFALTDDIHANYQSQRAGVYISDNDGLSWSRSANLVELAGNAMMEPGLVELQDGSILMNIRTELGSVYFSKSSDGGFYWESPQPSTIPSPAAPATMSRIPLSGELIILHNPVANVDWKGRTPLAVSCSPDDGETWRQIGLIEADTSYCYSYPSITWDGEEVLLTYYQWSRTQGNKNFQLTDLVFRKVKATWFKSRMRR